MRELNVPIYNTFVEDGTKEGKIGQFCQDQTKTSVSGKLSLKILRWCSTFLLESCIKIENMIKIIT